MVKIIILALLISTLTAGSGYCASSYMYDSRGKRDPFVPLVGVNVKAAESIEDILSIDDVNLQGIAADSMGRMFAIINSEIVHVGETRGRVTIEDVSRNSVKLRIEETAYTIMIYEE